MWHRHSCLCQVSPRFKIASPQGRAAPAGAQTRVSVPHWSLAYDGRHWLELGQVQTDSEKCSLRCSTEPRIDDAQRMIVDEQRTILGCAPKGSWLRIERSSMRSEGSSMRSEGSSMRSEGSSMRSEGSSMRSEGSLMRSEGSLMFSEGSLMFSEGSSMRSEDPRYAYINRINHLRNE
jgi:hypothetical protein